jgi:ADYC domain
MRKRLWNFIFLLMFHCVAPPGTCLGLSGQLQTEDAEFVLRLEDGRALRREALIGLTLRLTSQQGEMEVRIVEVDEDATATGGAVPLYRLSTRSPGQERSDDLCQPDARGRRAGFPMPDGSGGFSFTCTSGAEAKCVLMGYRPGEKRENVPLRELHQACVHMFRADYGGDDRPTTRNGTSIDLYDRFGIQHADMADGMRFEAGWGAKGAICVAHPRIAENITLEELAERYPRLAGHLGPQACSEEAARVDPQALLFNRSRVALPPE